MPQRGIVGHGSHNFISRDSLVAPSGSALHTNVKVAGRTIVLASRPMLGILEGLVAFVTEHERCGVLDGGVDNGYVWLQCSCGGLIMHPASEPPKTRAAS